MISAYENWETIVTSAADAEQIAGRTGLSLLAAGVLLQRLRDNPEGAEEWISPRLERILDPYELRHCREAARNLSRAIEGKRKIGVFSDYDVDGISSAALIARTVRSLGGEIHPFIPDRLEEGYGLSRAALERSFSKEVPDLLLVLDCGTRSEVELEWIANHGTEVIVVDHHVREDNPDLPDRCLLINPHLPVQAQPEFQWHCTAGLVFKLIHALVREWEKDHDGVRDKVNLRGLLDLVALGTVADLVPLRGENRIFVHHGLKQLAKTHNCGLKALLQVSQVDTGNPLRSTDIGFRIGPRINAGGRIDTGALALDLLLTDDNRQAFDLARKLDSVNSQRRTLERQVAEAAIERIGEKPPMGIVVWDKEWHPGVVGIVAGRLARRYHRPAIVLGWDGSGYKGSGRGVAGMDLLAVMKGCSVQPPKWGGHPAAMGLSTDGADLDAFAEAFAESVRNECRGKLPSKTLRIDATTEPCSVSRRTVLELEALGPFGQENPEPVIAVRSVRLEQPARLMGRDHIRFDLPGAEGVQVIGWRMAERMPPVGTAIDLAIRLSRSWWRGRESVRGELVDWRTSE